MNVTNPLLKMAVWEFIREFIQERNLTNALNVTNALLSKAVWEFIREFIQERNLTNVVNVTNALLNKAIREFIQERYLTNSLYVTNTIQCQSEKSSVFNTVENIYKWSEWDNTLPRYIILKIIREYLQKRNFSIISKVWILYSWPIS